MNLPKINMGSNQEEKIVTKELKIIQNVFIYNESIIPLCNISRVSIVNEQKKEYDRCWIIMIIVGVILTCTGVGAIVGAPLILIGAWMLYKIYQYNQELGEFLKLNLNSGQNIYFYSKEHDFTIRIMNVIANCVNSGVGYVINMDTYNIEALQVGDGNNMEYVRG